MESTVKITAAEVNKLRQATGAGMMECKRALVATEGDIEKAAEEMRISGQAKADKKEKKPATPAIETKVEKEEKIVSLKVKYEMLETGSYKVYGSI